jgi:hypothetical protein
MPVVMNDEETTTASKASKLNLRSESRFITEETNIAYVYLNISYEVIAITVSVK